MLALVISVLDARYVSTIGDMVSNAPPIGGIYRTSEHRKIG